MTDDGLLIAGATSQRKFGSCQLHVEFLLPFMPAARGQGRGNSGCYLQGRYEVQILDSFALDTVFVGGGSIYRQRKPDVNMCLPPMVWQTYDIFWEAPKWEGQKLLRPAYVTVVHNGVLLHHHKEVVGRMAHRVVGTYEPHDAEEPLGLQNHDTQVRYRNIWARRIKAYDQPE